METGREGVLDGAAKYLGLVTAAIATIYAVAYVLGFAYLSAFYSELGAPWVVDLYSTISIAQVPSPIAVLGISLALNYSTNKDALKDASFKEALIVAGIAVVFLVIHWGIERFMVGYKSYFVIVAMVLGAFAVLVLVVAYVRRALAVHGPSDGPRVLTVAVLFVSLMVTPLIAGHKAQKIRESRGVGLPSASLVAPDGGRWKLVTAIPPDQLLLVDADGQGRLVFRVVQVKDVAISERPKMKAR